MRCGKCNSVLDIVYEYGTPHAVHVSCACEDWYMRPQPAPPGPQPLERAVIVAGIKDLWAVLEDDV